MAGHTRAFASLLTCLPVNNSLDAGVRSIDQAGCGIYVELTAPIDKFRFPAKWCVHILNGTSTITRTVSQQIAGNMTKQMKFHGTTILSVRGPSTVAIGGDGQVTLGSSVMKGDAVKIRKMLDGNVLCGFAGSTADAFALLERFEEKLKDYPANVPRAATELAKQWRTDKALRQLEAMLIVVDAKHTLLVSGTGDVVQPPDGIVGIGSGGNYAIAAARALSRETSLSPTEIVSRALGIASEIDIYTNDSIIVEEIECQS